MRQKTHLVTALAFILCIGISISAAAYNEHRSIQYTAIDLFVIDLDILSTGKSESSVRAVASDVSYTMIIDLTLWQQEGSRWTVEKTWNVTTSSNTTLKKSWYVEEGYSYRLDVKLTVYDCNGDEIDAAFSRSPIVNY